MALLQIPITKAKAFIEIDDEQLPENVYREALVQGLKVLANRGQTKISVAGLTGEKLAEARKAALDKAEQTKVDLLAGKVRIIGAKDDGKVSGAVMTEARRIARNLVKDEMKRLKIKVSHIEASAITQAANGLIADHPEIIEQAKANLEARSKTEIKIDLSVVKPSPKKVAAAEAKKAKPSAEGQASAAKAGKVAVPPKAKPQAQPTAH